MNVEMNKNVNHNGILVCAQNNNSATTLCSDSLLCLQTTRQYHNKL